MTSITTAALAALALFAGACASTPHVAEVVPVPSATATDAPTEDTTEAEPDEPVAAEPALVARATGPLEVRDVPHGDVIHHLDATTAFGTRTVLLVVGEGEHDGWFEVLLPVRPNGSTGWVPADDVELRELTIEVQVDLESRTLTVVDEGLTLLETTVAIGDTDHPTPTGRFYVTDKLETGDPDGPYGPYAIGLSARSDVLTEFAGGDGQVGIHGTNNPASIGQAASHGCLRVDNTIADYLAHLLPLGTPVTIS
jgi:lipoprotein-anchoring transpeptidase ErfK/SrfK